MKKTIIIAVLAVLVGGGIGFWIGSRTVSSSAPNNGSAFQSGSATGSFGRRSGNGQSGNAVSGSVLKKDGESVAIQLPQGGSKIVFFSGDTRIVKTVSGTSDDLATGTMVIVNGSANSDGSISANSIQVRNGTSSFPFSPSDSGSGRTTSN